MTTTKADDVTNEPTGEAQGPSKPVTTHADWVPANEPEKPVAAPKSRKSK